LSDTGPRELDPENFFRKEPLTLYLTPRCRLGDMTKNIIKHVGRVLPVLAALTIGTIALGAEAKKDESMCVKQKDGSYLCKASGQKMDKPCCSTPDNSPKETPKPKQS